MNTSEPPNPLAFPFPLSHGRFSEGMTLRDYFAAEALKPLLIPVTAMLQAAGKSEAEIQEGIASMAYEMADAMLARRVQP